MANASTLINNFNAGEISPTLDFRSDLDKYYSGCKKMENFMPLLEGGATRVPGTYFCKAIKSFTPIKEARLISFAFSTIQSYIIEFGNQYIRFYKGQPDNGQIVIDQTMLNFDASAAYYVGQYCKIGKSVDISWAGSKHLYVAAPFGRSNSGTIKVIASTNGADTLAVSAAGVEITIAFANGTGAKNAANLIQAAVRVLATVNGVDVSDWIVTENAAYAAARPITGAMAATLLTGGEALFQALIKVPASTTNTNHYPPAESTYWNPVTAGNPVEIVTPYLSVDLFGLKFLQSADTLYIFHPSYAPKKLTRTSHIAWELSALLTAIQGEMVINAATTNNPCVITATRPVPALPDVTPMTVTGVTNANPCVVTVSRPSSLDFPIEGDIVYFSGVGGTTELNATFRTVANPDPDNGTFQLLGVDSSAFGVFTSGGSCYLSDSDWPENGDIVYIDDVVGMTELNGNFYEVTATNEATGQFSLLGCDATAFTAWASGGTAQKQRFGSADKCPSCGTFFEQRLGLGGSNDNPHTFNLSVSGDYENFAQGIEDDDSIEYTLVSDRVDRILWMEGRDSLFMGSFGGVWKVGATSSLEPVTATNITTDKIINIAAKDIEPEIANESILFLTKSGLNIRRISYDYNTDSWPAIDITRLAKHITLGATLALSGIIDLDFQYEPSPTLWAIRADGQILCLLYDTQENIYAWYRVVTDGVFESVAVISSEDNEDQIWVIVKRYINSSYVRYVEYFKPINFFEEIKDAFFVHSGLTWDGGAAVNITGISNANPAVVLAAGHTFVNTDLVRIKNVLGMTQINQGLTHAYTVANVVAGVSFQLSGINTSFSTAWATLTAYVIGDRRLQGGISYQCLINHTSGVFVTDLVAGKWGVIPGYGVYASGGTAQKVKKAFTTGLDHLIGETVDVIVDGAIYAPAPTVSATGTLTLTYYGNRIHIGLHCDATLEPMALNTTQGNIRGKKQKIYKIIGCFYKTSGGKAGPDENTLYDIPFNVGGVPVLTTDDVDFEFPGDWDNKATIVIKQDKPSPMTVLSIIPKIALED